MSSALDALNAPTRALIENIRRAGFPPLHTMTPVQARQAYRAGVGASHVESVALPRVEDLAIPASGGHTLTARLWAPTQDAGLPVLLYLHGGGFVVGGIETCEPMCRSVAAQSGAAVIAIDYRLAPEHRFPAALDDAWDALQWLVREGHGLRLDASRLAVAGDSAGGTLAASAALLARAAGIPLRLQALFYPSVQTTMQTESATTYGTGLMLDAALMAWFERQSRSADEDPGWRRQPLTAPSHAGLAPAWIGIAECDPLADDGRLYARALEAAGVPVQVALYPGTVHDFINMGRFLPQAAQAHTELAMVVRQALQG